MKKNNNKIKPENKSAFNSQSLDVSGNGSDRLGSKRKVEKVEFGDEKVTTYIEFDEKAKEQIRNLLQNDLKFEVQEIKKDFLIIFGLFASFVTFISVNVQIFKNNDNSLELIGICSVSLSFIIFFALIINSIVKQQIEWFDFKRPVYIMNMIFLIIGVTFILFSDNSRKHVILRLKQKSVADSIKINEIKSLVLELQNEVKMSRFLIEDYSIESKNSDSIVISKPNINIK